MTAKAITVFPLSTDGLISKAIFAYVGRPLDALEVALDANTPGVYGVRVYYRNTSFADFLIKGTTPAELDVTPTQYPSWPPTRL